VGPGPHIMGGLMNGSNFSGFVPSIYGLGAASQISS